MLEHRAKQITRELFEELSRNKQSILTGPYLLFAIITGTKRILSWIFLSMRRCNCDKAASLLYMGILFLRKYEVKIQSGTYQNSEEGKKLKELIMTIYDGPIHIIDMVYDVPETEIAFGGIGYYKKSYHNGTIVIEKNVQTDRQAYIMVHELVHALFQQHDESNNTPLYARNEVVAESVAYIICTALGIVCDKKKTLSYINGYLPYAKTTLEQITKDIELTAFHMMEYLKLTDQITA